MLSINADRLSSTAGTGTEGACGLSVPGAIGGGGGGAEKAGGGGGGGGYGKSEIPMLGSRLK